MLSLLSKLFDNKRLKLIEQKSIIYLFQMFLKNKGLHLRFDHSKTVCVGQQTVKTKIVISPPRLFTFIWMLMDPYLRVGESYVNKQWDIIEGDILDVLYVFKTSGKSIYRGIITKLTNTRTPLFYLDQLLFADRRRKKVFNHYNIDILLYKHMLDKTLTYSCGFYQNWNQSLLDAQENKLKITIDRLDIKQKKLKILDFGCGWGELSRRLAANQGVHVTGISISEEQISWCKKKKEEQSFITELEYHLIDFFSYRPNELFDRIVSIGALEHIGFKKYKAFFKKAKSLLNDNGIMLLHFMVRPFPNAVNRWFDNYIFPGYFLPSISEVLKVSEQVGFDHEQVFIHEPRHYQLTLRHWRENFRNNWHNISHNYDERFYRMWDFYLSALICSFDKEVDNFKIVQLKLKK